MRIVQISFVLLCSLAYHTAFGHTSTKTPPTASELIARGDSCYAVLHSFEAFHDYEAASKTPGTDSMLAWRFAKVYTAFGLTAINQHDEQWNYEFAKTYADRALQYDSTNEEAHVSLAVYSGWRTFYDTDNESKIRDSRAMYLHVTRAIQLNPGDDIAYNLLGQWNREVAKLSWVTKALVAIIYGGLPKASFQEAIQDFQHAIALQPQRIMHYDELGKTYIAMGDKDQARKIFQTAIQMPSIDGVDEKLKNEMRASLLGELAE